LSLRYLDVTCGHVASCLNAKTILGNNLLLCFLLYSLSLNEEGRY